ncbi:hypothetical protein pb186bvf_001441 [Paramecium bursaria]
MKTKKSQKQKLYAIKGNLFSRQVKIEQRFFFLSKLVDNETSKENQDITKINCFLKQTRIRIYTKKISFYIYISLWVQAPTPEGSYKWPVHFPSELLNIEVQHQLFLQQQLGFVHADSHAFNQAKTPKTNIEQSIKSQALNNYTFMSQKKNSL